MRLFYDIDRNTWVTDALSGSPAWSAPVRCKQGDTAWPVTIQFLRDGSVHDYGAGATGKFGIKAGADLSGDFLAYDSSWTRSGSGVTAVFAFLVSLNTTEITAAIAAAAAPVGAVLEVEVTTADGIESTVSLPLLIERPAITGNEGVPTSGTPSYPAATDVLTISGNLVELASAPTAHTARVNLGLSDVSAHAGVLYTSIFPQILPYITGLTGGGATNLDGIPTVDLGAGGSLIAIIILDGVAKVYQLKSSVEAEASPGFIRPDDFEQFDNQKVWRQIL